MNHSLLLCQWVYAKILAILILALSTKNKCSRSPIRAASRFIFFGDVQKGRGGKGRAAAQCDRIYRSNQRRPPCAEAFFGCCIYCLQKRRGAREVGAEEGPTSLISWEEGWRDFDFSRIYSSGVLPITDLKSLMKWDWS